MKMHMPCILITYFLASNLASAASISVDAFSGSEFVEDFSTLAVAQNPNDRVITGEFGIGELTFSQNNVGPNWGWRNIDEILTDDTEGSHILIDFDTAYSKVGLDVGFFSTVGTASYNVLFFGAGGFLGSVTVAPVNGSSLPRNSEFAGWEELTGITRIGIIETTASNFSVTGIDNIRFEGAVSVVPIPAALWLFGSGLGLIGWLGRSRT